MKGLCVDIDEEELQISDSIKIINEKLFKQHQRRTHKLVDPMLNTNKYWIPALFKIDGNYKVEIISEINNLPFYKYGQILYPLIATLFQNMIPSFEWILSTKLKNKTIQVIVDMKTYQLLGGNTMYKGSYHREGYRESEGIEAVGIYYFDKTNTGFKKDIFELETSTYIVCGGSQSHKKEINIENDMILVFNNDIFNHRLKELETVNTSDRNKVFERSIISFYIPRYKINSSEDIMVNGEKYMIILDNWLREFDDKNQNKNNWIDTSVKLLLQNYISKPMDKVSDELRRKLKAERLNITNGGFCVGAIN